MTRFPHSSSPACSLLGLPLEGSADTQDQRLLPRKVPVALKHSTYSKAHPCYPNSKRSMHTPLECNLVDIETMTAVVPEACVQGFVFFAVVSSSFIALIRPLPVLLAGCQHQYSCPRPAARCCQERYSGRRVCSESLRRESWPSVRGPPDPWTPRTALHSPEDLFKKVKNKKG